MAENSKIDAKDAKWAPVRVRDGSPALSDDDLTLPLRWRKPRRARLSDVVDLFHEAVPDAWIDRVFAVMALAPQHTFQVLTKRPERAREYLGGDRFAESHATERIGYAAMTMIDEATGGDETKAPPWPVDHSIISSLLHGPTPPIPGVCWPRREVWPLPNVWLGTSVEDQTTADERIPHLLDTPAAVRFISAEPLLGPVDLTELDGHATVGEWFYSALDCDVDAEDDDWGGATLDWVICGGESGPGARPMHPDWARSLRDQCEAAGVAFHFKQWGEWAHHEKLPAWVPGDCDWPENADGACVLLPDGRRDWGADGAMMQRIGKRAAGRLLDGRTHDAAPEPLT
jgi:protein gp37